MVEAGTTISSRSNPIVRRFREIARGADTGLMLLDGPHLLRDAIDADADIQLAAFDASALDADELDRLARRLPAAVRVQASAAVMGAISPARSPSGVVAIAARPQRSWEDLLQPEPALILIAVDVQDPGNLGAIVRAADAGGATGVIAAGRSADPFGWKALRGAMGSALRLPLLRSADTPALLARARAERLSVVATIPAGGVSPEHLDLTRPTALLLGSEGLGLEPALAAGADSRVTVPMRPGVDSLNVAVAAALLVYEARRQRGH